MFFSSNPPNFFWISTQSLSLRRHGRQGPYLRLEDLDVMKSEQHRKAMKNWKIVETCPIGSMYGIFTYIWLFLMVKYGKCR